MKAQRISMDDHFKNIFLTKYLVVGRTTRSEFLVVLTHFLVIEDTRTREFCCPEIIRFYWKNVRTGIKEPLSDDEYIGIVEMA